MRPTISWKVQTARLNPCFCGSRSVRRDEVFASERVEVGLNPCFCGSRSVSEKKRDCLIISSTVLILVFVEVGL